MLSKQAQRWMASLVGILISAIFVWYSIENLEWVVFASSIKHVNLFWVVVFNLSLLLTMIMRAYRWFLITGLPSDDRRYVFEACSLGYLGTAIFPARFGEVMRVVHLQRSRNASAGLAIMSSIIDRFFDLFALCLLLIVGLQISVSDWGIGPALVTTSAIFLIGVAVVGLLQYTGHLNNRLTQLLNKGGKIGQRIAVWYDDAQSQLQLFRDPSTLLRLLGLQICISTFDVISCWILFLAFGWSLPINAAVLVLVCLMIAASLPSTPGYIGVYQVAAMTALYSFSVGSSEALAYGTILQICNFGLFLMVGLWAYLVSKKQVSANCKAQVIVTKQIRS